MPGFNFFRVQLLSGTHKAGDQMNETNEFRAGASEIGSTRRQDFVSLGTQAKLQSEVPHVPLYMLFKLP